MNKLEKLELEAHDNNIGIYDYHLGDETLKGYYIDGNITINTCVNNSTAKKCILAEELGQRHTTVRNTLDMTDISN